MFDFTITKKQVINRFLAPLLFAFLSVSTVEAQNPLIIDQFTADPSARVFNNRVYVYPSHDIPCGPGKGRVGWFCMEDYHVFSSADLSNWTDHGMIVSQTKVPWADSTAYSMWAPDCIYRNGKYYFYFPTKPIDSVTYGRGFTIGVATSDKPSGPFKPELLPIKNVRGIDPNVFIDKDGQAYLYWSQGNIYGAKLKENMLELASDPVVLAELPTKGLKEGPYLFERNGKYYLTYPHVEKTIERLEYAMGDNPMGPFKVTGVIMDESPTGCWTNHHSLLSFKDQWYLFYHHNDLSPAFDKNRSIRMDSLSFNNDGTIRKVLPTLRGVGLTDASRPIQADRYTNISSSGVAINFLDTTDKFKGWKTVLSNPAGWVQYNSVDFKSNIKQVSVRAHTNQAGTLLVRLDKIDGPVVATVVVPPGVGFKNVEAKVSPISKGVHHLFISSSGNAELEMDWLTFR